MSSSAFTPTVLTISGTGGSGNGEKNYITNPSMASATTGWNVIGDFTLSRSTSSSELPREYTTATGIKIVANTNPQSAADYVYFDFNLDDVDLNRKLKIQWSQKKIGTFAGTNMAVVITSQSDRTTALYTPVTTAIPAIDGDFQTSFDSASTAALSLVIRGTSTDMATGDGICISDVIVGPGEIVQGAVVSEWQSYTPTFSAGLGSVSTINFWYKRVGTDIEIQGSFLTGTVAGSVGTFTLPGSLTVGSTAIASRSSFGIWHAQPGTAGSVFTYGGVIVATALGANTIGFDYQVAASTSIFSARNGNTIFNSSSIVTLHAVIPIAEWSGSGTVNLGPGAQVEFASVGGTWDADSSTTVYGPSGSTMGGALTATRDKTITWQYPPQSDDILTLEFKFASTDGGYVPLADVWPNDNSNVGAYILQTDSTGKTVVRFRRYRTGTSDWLNTYQWRVRKAKASSPVGFGIATTDSSGLVKNRTDNADIAAASLTWSTATGTITVDAGDILLFKWRKLDDLVLVTFKVGGITLSSSTTSVSVILPSTVPVSIADIYSTCIIFNNSGSVATVGQINVGSGGRTLGFAIPGGSFAATSNSTYLYGQFYYPIA